MRWLILILMATPAVPAQQPASGNPERTRDLWDSTLIARRPPGKKAARAASTSAGADTLVGVTIWRMRPSRSGDEPRVRALIHEEDGDRQWTPERISADTALTEGQRVRVSVETSRSGYLYVVDREEYAGHIMGDPYLIFPTTRLRSGDNHVVAGTVVEIPGPADTPPYFKVQRNRPDQVNEVLTIVVSPRKIEEVPVTREHLKLSADMVAGWEKKWKAKVLHLETPGSAGKAYTVAEKNAGEGGRLLTQDDPVPQTMFRIEARPGDPLLVDLPLRIAR